ncbi:MAG: hypothetical protein ACI33J_05415 [Clostridium sp.]
MAVEKAGPKGFDYQYIITLSMVLYFMEKEDIEVYVENNSFEDAQISYQNENHMITIDLQVKYRVGEISLREFSSWLSHFKKYSSEFFILEKIQNDENNYLVFVTNNRCTDKVSRFLWNDYEIGMNGVCLSKNDLQELKENIILNLNHGKEIGNKRLDYLKRYLNQITDTQLRKVLKKVLIIERKEYNEVEIEICRVLKIRYCIPESECAEVLRQMLEIVKKGRDLGQNIVSEIKEIIKNKSYRRVLPYDEKYCERGMLKILEKNVLESHILLLTGMPFSGKTYLAKAIAQKFQEEGYWVKQTDNILADNEAYYFLCAPENDQRLLVLEDPFGHINKRENAVEILDRIKSLIREKISSNRKMIITTRKDILFEVYKKNNIEQCNLLDYRWFDTSITEYEEAKNIWECCFGTSAQSKKLLNDMYDFFQTNGELNFLEVGEIRHLSIEISDVNELLKMPISEVVRKARISSDEVCQKISLFGEEYRQLYILLGCFCNTIRSISIDDLAYILCGNEEKVSIRRNQGKCEKVSLGKYEEKRIDASFPEYREKVRLDSGRLQILRKLCENGYIYRNQFTNEIVFQHPIFAYASQKLLYDEITQNWDVENILCYMYRAIGSLSKNAAICSLIHLEQYFELDKFVIDCFVDASNSIFPAVRDIATLFLDKNFDKIGEPIQIDFMENIQNNRIDDEHLCWNNDECWYQIKNMYYYDFSDFRGMQIDITNEEIVHRIETNNKFSPKEIYDILYSHLGEVLPLNFLEYALLCDEAIIRSKAMYFIFKNYSKVLNLAEQDYLLQFENYNVVYSMLKGALNNWKGFNSKNKNLLIEYFKKQFNRKSVALYSKKLFELFGVEYKSEAIDWDKCTEEEKKELWKVWANLFSKWLKVFPSKYIRMDEPHMIYTTNNSLKYLKNQQEIIEVGKAWIYWLHNYIKYHRPNDYGMSVLSYIIEGTEMSSNLRCGIVQQVLEETDSNIVTSHMFHLINNWSFLEDEEKKFICQYLQKEDRLDYKWIQAIAIVQRFVPKEIQKVICGDVFLDKTPREIMDILDKNKILEECVCVYCGFPQPLWFNGYHHSGSCSLWDSILIEILRKGQLNRCYYVALREFIDSLYNDESTRFIGGYEIYKELLSKKTDREKIFERLAYTVTQNQDNKKMWDDLLKMSTQREKEQYFKKISEFIEMEEMKNISFGGLITEFELEDIKTYLLPFFSADKDIIQFSEVFLNIYQTMNSFDLVIDEKSDNDFIYNYEKIIKYMYQNNPPRLLFTNEVVKMICRKMNVISSELLNILEKRRKDFCKRYELVKKNFEENCPLDINDNFALKNWCETMYTQKG